MNIKESIQQINELIEAWELNEACLNQTDINAMQVLLKENQELKIELSGYRQAILNNKEMLGLKEKNQELKKQVETYEIEGYEQNEELNKRAFDIRKYKVQQKEFIKYLEDESKEIYRDGGLRQNIFRQILQKYKEIVNGINGIERS